MEVDINSLFTATDNPRGVFNNENYRIVNCYDGHITFSYASKGKAMTVHFSSDRAGLRKIKEMSDLFCQWLFNNYDCPVIFAAVAKHRTSIMMMVSKIGFVYIADDSKHCIFMRLE